MPQSAVRRIALRAVQFAIAAAGILLIFLVFSRQADAAALDPPPAPAPATPAPLTAATSGVTSATSAVTSTASGITSATTGTTTAASAVTSGAPGATAARHAGLRRPPRRPRLALHAGPPPAASPGLHLARRRPRPGLGRRTGHAGVFTVITVSPRRPHQPRRPQRRPSRLPPRHPPTPAAGPRAARLPAAPAPRHRARRHHDGTGQHKLGDQPGRHCPSLGSRRLDLVGGDIRRLGCDVRCRSSRRFHVAGRLGCASRPLARALAQVPASPVRPPDRALLAAPPARPPAAWLRSPRLSHRSPRPSLRRLPFRPLPAGR